METACHGLLRLDAAAALLGASVWFGFFHIRNHRRSSCQRVHPFTAGHHHKLACDALLSPERVKRLSEKS